MSWRTLVVANRYEDSVRLLALARELRGRDGVRTAEVLVGSEGNCRSLAARHGVDVQASASDVVVAVEGDDEDALEDALDGARAHFERPAAAPAGAGPVAPARSVLTAGARVDANVALVSVPGEYAALEAAKALAGGLHVFLFSDRVPVAEEVVLKRAAADRGLLVMGPGCGTAMVAGAGLGFSNVVRPGPVGIVAAAGTGAQEVACLLDAEGVGVSQIIGVGGGDLSAEVRGEGMLAGARLLAADESTGVIALVSKAVAPEAAAALDAELATGKPVVAGFVGHDGEGLGFPVEPTLERTALHAARLARGEDAGGGAGPETQPPAAAMAARARLAPGQRAVRGLYSGGTLCGEAEWVLESELGPLSAPHLLLDMGAEEFTEGRPHPMVDLGPRTDRLLEEAGDREVACLLLDVVLGHGAHPDPAGELAPAIVEARRRAREDGRELAVVAHVCGAEGDPQDLAGQQRLLAGAGAIVCPTGAGAARAAAAIVAPARRAAGAV
jgi:FdrA protein